MKPGAKKPASKKGILAAVVILLFSCCICGVVGSIVDPEGIDTGERKDSASTSTDKERVALTDEERREQYEQALLNRFPGPDEQKFFIRQHQIRFENWKNEDNPLRKGERVRDAELWAEQFWAKRNNRVGEWQGVVHRLTGGADDATIRIHAGDGRRLGPYKMEFFAGLSLLRLSDAIPADSQAYQVLRDLKRGDCVVFSGEIQPKMRDHLRSPEYSFQRLDMIRRCD